MFLDMFYSIYFYISADTVYMEKEDERQEYVLNDRGRIWVGSKRSYEGIPWYFGQVRL